MIEITEAIAKKVVETVDAGLVHGKGKPIPGQMCVEAAVCFAMGLPHGDNPSCVAPILRSLKIGLNDRRWSSSAARAKGLRRLAVAQLGSAGHLDEAEFRRRIVDMAIRRSVPSALRSAAKVNPTHAEGRGDPDRHAGARLSMARARPEGGCGMRLRITLPPLLRRVWIAAMNLKPVCEVISPECYGGGAALSTWGVPRTVDPRGGTRMRS